MKRFTASLLVLFMIATFAGCDKNGIVTGQKDGKVQYSEDQVLFVAQDRCDIDEDQYNVYSYNYKGELIKTTDTSQYIGYYSTNGLAPAADQRTGKVGFVDKDGVFQIEPKYVDAAPFSNDGIALVKISVDGEYEEKCGYINSKGEEVTPCIYDTATSFYNTGYALAVKRKEMTDEYGYTSREDWKQCIINKNGDSVIEIDITVENRKIVNVYKDYFVCTTDDGLAIFDYSDNKLYESKTNQNEFFNAKEDGFYIYVNGKAEKFDGKKFVEVENNIKFQITSKRVATTQSGFGYGVVENGETVIPFEYDMIYKYGEYFVAIKYTGNNVNFDQVFDIYDKNYNKTAENIQYAFSTTRYDMYGSSCYLPDGYFEVKVENVDYEWVCGIIDYTGKVIVEPVFGRGITLCTYEGTGVFDW